MQSCAICSTRRGPGRLPSKTIVLMNWMALFLFAFLMHAHAGSFSQGITLSEKNAPLSKLFRQIEKQTGCTIWYEKEEIEKTGNVSVRLQHASLEQALEACIQGKPLEYAIIGRMVAVKSRSAGNSQLPDQAVVRGKVLNEKGEPLAGATITVKGTLRTVATDETGSFLIGGVSTSALLAVSHVGYETQEIRAGSKNTLIIRMRPVANKLDEVQIIGYGTTTRRYNTGSVSKINSKEIEEQPVTNVLSALSGRAAGVFVQTTNGLPGGGVTIQVRGKGSIAAGTDPLYVIDGVPFASSVVASDNIMAFSAINGAVSPFNSLNPDDIESISILKDADATAIYGSRGSGGVILITTKKGKAGKARVTLKAYGGIEKTANLPSLLHGPAYLQIRREAFRHDGLVPSPDPNDPAYAPDLLVWDTTRHTNWASYMLGRTAQVLNLQGNISGGDEHTSFTAGGNFRTQTTVLPGSTRYERAGMHMNIQHSSADNRFSVLFSTTYNEDNNQLSNPTAALVNDLLLPPDFPLYDAAGNLNWYLGSNPLADIKARTRTQTDNIITNMSLRYEILPNLHLKVDAGYNRVSIGQVMTYPSASLYPGSTNYSNFGNNAIRSLIVEPQADYHFRIKKSHVSLLAGGTWQESQHSNEFIQASNFSNENLLQDLGSAQSYYANNSKLDYKYVSVFSRLTYDYDNKYILNASVRRDGSSRFGPGNEFGNFGALGAAWLFTKERWMREKTSFVSYGKLRASYGITGNDQIPDYQFLSAYGSANIYQDTVGLSPLRAANPQFRWETDQKMEVALELGFFSDRILLTVERYQNRSGNQLVTYSLPVFTGFSGYQVNLPAVVNNTGWELELNTKNIRKGVLTWSTSFNITLPKNRLKSFPGISTSSYAQTLVVGQDITRIYGYRLDHIDSSGSPVFYEQSGNSGPYYYATIGRQTPDFYGGIGNSLSFRGWVLEIFGQFARQLQQGGLSNTPGLLINNYSLVLDRWQKPGDHTLIPAATTNYNFYYGYSSANYFESAYFRLKNISISYSLPSAWLKKNRVSECKFYAMAENLLTLWNRKNPFYDPETGASSNIPPMKSFVAGIQVSL